MGFITLLEHLMINKLPLYLVKLILEKIYSLYLINCYKEIKKFV